MREKARERYSDTESTAIGQQDSPTILNLIEQLNRDLEETQRADAKVK
ncbi:MAG TPA: hypothetical protein VH596_05160 [Terriglobales bacterium]|jgi:hypothetical protein